ncbi:MAG: outer membrane lipoprotein chaperone LolA [bacterium]
MKKLIFIFLLLIPFSFLFPQKSNEVIDRLQKKFASIEDMQADFVNTISAPSGDSPQKRTGKFFYKKSNKYVFEFSNHLIVSNSKTIWNYNKKQKRVMINNTENDPSAFAFERYIKEYPQKCDVQILGKEGSELTKIELTSKDDESEFSSIVLWIDNADLVRKFEVVNPDGASFHFELSNIKINKGLSEAKFNFTPPEGSKIVDLR